MQIPGHAPQTPLHIQLHRGIPRTCPDDRHAILCLVEEMSILNTPEWELRIVTEEFSDESQVESFVSRSIKDWKTSVEQNHIFTGSYTRSDCH